MVYTIIYEIENDAAMREVVRMKEAMGSSLINCRIHLCDN